LVPLRGSMLGKKSEFSPAVSNISLEGITETG
jgi:hypothetical protein